MSKTHIHFIIVSTICLFFIVSCTQITMPPQTEETTFKAMVSDTEVEVGDTVIVEGFNASVGMPQYSLSIEQDEADPIFEPISHENQSSASFTLTAVRAGTATFTMSVNGEVADTAQDGSTFWGFTTLSDSSDPVSVVESVGSLFNQGQLDLLAKSRVTWDEKSAEANGNYAYLSEFESWVGFGSKTTIHVTNDVVTKRVYEGYNAYRQPEPDEAYEEDADSLGSNPAGAPASTIDELYDQCAEILKTKNPAGFYINFELFDNNILKYCEFASKDCADDCSEGVRIDALSFTN